LLDRFGGRIGFDQTAQAGKALQLCFSDVDFTIDLVAAFADPDEDSELVDIADRKGGHWEPSNTRELLRVLAERNKATDGRFIHQVRMVKEFKGQHPELGDLCGLAVESLTYGAVTQKMPHARAVAATLGHAATAVLGRVSEPTGIDDLSRKWTDAERQTFARIFAAGACCAEEALRLEQDSRTTAAIDTWSSLLGEDFPAVPPQSASDTIAELAKSGSITTTGRATSSMQGASRARPTRAWRSH
jgi:hypothetical protein